MTKNAMIQELANIGIVICGERKMRRDDVARYYNARFNQPATTEPKKEEEPMTIENREKATNFAMIGEGIMNCTDTRFQYIDVKPRGIGIKIGNTRVCAVYLGRAGYRVKSNKLAALNTINVEKKLTSDGRDYLIDLSTDNQVYDLLGQLVTALGI